MRWLKEAALPDFDTAYTDKKRRMVREWMSCIDW